MLYVFGGLPGVGKSTLAEALTRERNAVYLCIDTIEQVLGRTNQSDIGERGYIVAYAMALDNLRLGVQVIADCANTVEITRAAWRGVAERSGHRYVEIEVVCSDRDERRNRVEVRREEACRPNLPNWKDVTNRTYEQWMSGHIVLDTAGQSIEQGISLMLDVLSAE